jgi:hypothetical protein
MVAIAIADTGNICALLDKFEEHQMGSIIWMGLQFWLDSSWCLLDLCVTT